METLTSNLRKTTRREILHGREFLVAPITLLKEGVLNGSQGSLFYPAKEIAKSVDSWNGIPLMLRHPQDSDGNSLSGRTPAANQQQGIGTIYNARLEDGKLIGESWFDLQVVRNLSPDVANSLSANKPIELSTGLFTDNEKAPEGSEFEGEPFDFIAKNYRPDHLAILPDQVGACSLEDGCGVLNTETEQTENPTHTEGSAMALTTAKKVILIDKLIANCGYCDDSDKPTLNELSDEKLLARETDMEKRLADEAVVNAVKDYAGAEEKDLVAFVVNAAKAKNQDDEEEEEDEDKKKKLPAFLKKNKTKNQDDEEEEEEEEKVVAKNAKPQTEEEWFAAAPSSVQNSLKFAREIEDKEKRQLIANITANVESDEQKKAVVNLLKGKDLAEIRALAILAPATAKEEAVANFSYMGAQGSSQLVENNEFDPDDVLETPTMNFEFAK